MAEVIGQLTRNSTKGEAKLFNIFKKYLDDSVTVYYNTEIMGYYPDFIILHPEKGIIVIEVKDWDLSHINSINREKITLNINGKTIEAKNPVKQVRDYTLKLIDSLKKRNALNRNGKLSFYYAYAIILPNISNADIENNLWGNKILEAFGKNVFTYDWIQDKNSLNSLINKLIKNNCSLKDYEIDEIRGVIFPEITIKLNENEIIGVLDKNQEKIARNYRPGHKLIRGVSGSGKTVMLLARAKFLSGIHPDWKMLILTYNKILAHFISNILKDFPNIEVSNYHRWCMKIIRKLNLEIPNMPENIHEMDKYWNETIPEILLNTDISKLPKYQAIFIDEGQDFMNSWYRSIIRFIDEHTNELMIVYDNSQNIYKRTVNWKKLGINIVGRTEIMKINYRNTKEIVDTAYKIIEDLDRKGILMFEENATYLKPTAVRSGEKPFLKILNTTYEYAKVYLYELVKRLMLKEGKTAVLTPSNEISNELESFLKMKNLNLLNIHKINREFKDTDKFKLYLSTIHSVKGLEFDHVVIFAPEILEKYFSLEESLRLLYTAITRAMNRVFIIVIQNNHITDLIKNNF